MVSLGPSMIGNQPAEEMPERTEEKAALGMGGGRATRTMCRNHDMAPSSEGQEKNTMATSPRKRGTRRAAVVLDADMHQQTRQGLESIP